MKKEYNPKEFGEKWQDKWFESGIYEAKDFDKSKPKYYLFN